VASNNEYNTAVSKFFVINVLDGLYHIFTIRHHHCLVVALE